MNDIDFIKKSVPFADEFELEYSHGLEGNDLHINIVYPSHRKMAYEGFISDVDIMTSFLTRTIEGINRKSFQENGRFEIRTYRWGISIQDNVNMLETALPNHDHQSIDEMKRSAIEYVLRNSP